MTTADKKNYLRMFRKFQAAREQYYKPKFHSILNKQVRQIIDKDPVPFEPMYTQLIALYREVSVAWGDKVRLSIKRQQKGRMPIGFSQRIYEILRDTYGIDLLQDAMDITEVTKKLVQEVLTKAALEGLNIDDVVKKLVSKEFNEVRARRIARTETVAASNIAGDIVAKESGLTMNKEWLAVLDHRTRSDHEQVHGTVIKQEAKFDVGGTPMRFPGDRGTDGVEVPADETINCRCVALYLPINPVG